MFDTVPDMELAAVQHAGSGGTGDDPASDGDALRDVLARLGDRVAPIGLARERTLPVADVLRDLFPERGLVRGRIMACSGAAATSIALITVREAMLEGAWLAAVDVTTLGGDAAAELGIPLERVVRIETTSVGDPADTDGDTDGGTGGDTADADGTVGGRVAGGRDAGGRDAGGRDGDRSAAVDEQVSEWIDVMGAAADGFDLIVTRVPVGLRSERRPAALRKLLSRLQRRGVVVLVLGDPGAVACDVSLTTASTVWSGLGDGAGHLRRRRIGIEATGRRQPGRRHRLVDLAGSAARVELSAVPDVVVGLPGVEDHGPLDTRRTVTDVAEVANVAEVAGRDPQAEVLAEMRAAEARAAGLRVAGNDDDVRGDDAASDDHRLEAG